MTVTDPFFVTQERCCVFVPVGASLLEGDCRGLRRMLELPANR